VVLSLAGLASPAAPISVSISPAVDLRHEQRLLVRP
jgi:hypothetical protein